MNPGGAQPGSSRLARQSLILALIESKEITSQAELAELLAVRGISVSQSTLSKDLLEIGAVRVRGTRGGLVYAPPGSDIVAGRAAGEGRLAKICADVLISADSSGNLCILKTPPGAAQYFAWAIDGVAQPDIVGSIAGDDTLMVISRDPNGGAKLARMFTALAHAGHEKETER